MAAPLTVLQEREPVGAAFCAVEEGKNGTNKRGNIRIPETLRTRSPGIRTGLQDGVPEATGLVLDINTAGTQVSVSEDRRSASYSLKRQRRPQTPERFQLFPQALSARTFPSGRHYWEVEGSESGLWLVGAAYPSIERGGEHSCLGYNARSWGLCRWDNNTYTVRHGSKITDLIDVPNCPRIRIWLDYEAGHLSFYELSEPIRHLHTFSASFTEPLHAAFGVWRENSWVRIIS
uniref:B30.2/SPRY domain-containing protein n=1 Tax=Xenopus tropicalis TaxID=8364 RepID=A0A1B8XW61_XENTR